MNLNYWQQNQAICLKPSMQISDHLSVSPSGPFPPQNLSLSHVTPNSAMITWSRHPRSIPDGFVINVTRGLNTRSRFLPNGKLGLYTLRELTPGQHYYVALMSVKNMGQEQIHSMPQHLAFTTCECQLFWQLNLSSFDNENNSMYMLCIISLPSANAVKAR